MHNLRHRRGLMPAIGTAAIALAMAGCSSSSGASSSSSTEGSSSEGSSSSSAAATTLKVAMVTKPIDNTYFGAMASGAQDAADELGVELQVAAAQNVSDDTGQASTLSALVSKGFDCYVLNPTSPTNLIAPLKNAGDATIINIDLVMDTEAAKAQGVTVSTYLGTINEEAGAQGGTAMTTLLPDGSKVAIIGTLAQDAGNIARQKGFHSVVDGKLDVVQTVSADADKAKAKADAAAIMRSDPEVKGFFTPSGDQAQGIQAAIEQEGRTADVKVVGVDGTKDELQSILDGKQAATVQQFPYLMGYQAIQGCVAAKAGKTLPATVSIPTNIVTKENAQASLDSYPAPPAGMEIKDPFAG